MDPLAGRKEFLEALGFKPEPYQEKVLSALEEHERAAAGDELDRRLKEIRESGRKVGVRETVLLAELSAKAGRPTGAVEFTPEAARFKRLCSPARRGKVSR